MRPSSVSLGLILGCLGGATKLHAQVQDQIFEVQLDSARASIGDTITIRFRLRLDERDLLYDTVPKPVGDLPDGVRIFSVERLVRRPDRIFEGRAKLAFYRVGPQPIPVFWLPFMRAVKGVTRANVLSDSASVEIVPLLPGGSPTLRDIKEIEPARGPGLLLPGLAGSAALLGYWYLRRRRRRLRPAAPVPVEIALPPPLPPDPYELALARLEEISRERWAVRGEVARHYEAVADVLRGYLEAAARVPARERTTSELLWTLPPRLAEGGLRRRCHEVLGEADLVKFARRRPGPGEAESFLGESRDLLSGWRSAGAAREELNAVR
jgi:hypothetical protein